MMAYPCDDASIAQQESEDTFGARAWLQTRLIMNGRKTLRQDETICSPHSNGLYDRCGERQPADSASAIKFELELMGHPTLGLH